MARIKLLISYDGTDYCGWQKQKDHAFASELPTLQETIEIALSRVFNEPIALSASGRTDAGVHALAQVGHFNTEKPLPKDLCWALRSLLPPSIVIKAAWQAPEDFHSTLSATHKTYRYWIWNKPRSSALLHRYSWWIRQPLDTTFLNEASQYLIKKQDFKSFQSTGTTVQTTVREIFNAEWKARSNGIVEFQITGSGFLKQMVRNVAGTLINLHQKSQPAEMMEEIIAARDRRKAGVAAPPNGLFLYKVYYPRKLDNKCRRI